MAVRLTLYGVVVVLAVVGLFVGAADVTFGEVWDALLGGDRGISSRVVTDIRLPRIVGGIVVGFALAGGGVGLQGAYRNRLAEPYLLGISSAAGLGFLIGAMTTNSGAAALIPTLAAALAGSCVALLTRRWADRVTTANGLVLVGVALNFVFLAWTLILTFAVDSPRIPTFVYFVFGSLGTVTWTTIWTALPIIMVGLAVLAGKTRALDLIALGDDEARSLGVGVPRTNALVLAAVGAVVGAAVALAGVVGFVGLVAPFLARRWTGPGHAGLIGTSLAIGAIFVLVSDIAIRAFFAPVEVPLGVVTAAIGGPLLVGMLVWSRQ